MAHLLAIPCRAALTGALSRDRGVAKCLPRVAASPYSGHRAAAMPHAAPRNAVSRRSVLARAGKVEKITGEQLEVAIASRDTTLIVDFFATWCGPCLLLARELEQVAETMDGKVKVVKIDVDENPDLANMLRISGLPTIVFIPKDNGRPALRTEGWLPAAQIMDIVGQLDAGQVVTPPEPQTPLPE